MVGQSTNHPPHRQQMFSWLKLVDNKDSRTCFEPPERFDEWAFCRPNTDDPPDRKPTVAPHKNQAPHRPCRNKKVRPSRPRRPSPESPRFQIESHLSVLRAESGADVLLVFALVFGLKVAAKSPRETAIRWHRCFPPRRPATGRAA